MTPVVTPSARPKIVYPESDGAPIAESTLQFDWITTIKGGLGLLYANDPNVFVAGDLFWYPVEGHPEVVMAPDALVVFGRPKGHRPSYMQWLEGGISPQVVFEVLSPRNRFPEMLRKFEFYQAYGVEEYYVYDPAPERLDVSGVIRRGEKLVEIAAMNGHVSPRLGIRFELNDAGLRIIRPDGEPFMPYEELGLDAARQRSRADQAQAEVECLRERLRALGQDPG